MQTTFLSRQSYFTKQNEIIEKLNLTLMKESFISFTASTKKKHKKKVFNFRDSEVTGEGIMEKLS